MRNGKQGGRSRNGSFAAMFRTARELVAGTLLDVSAALLDVFKEGIQETVRRSLLVILFYAIAAALLGAGFILLLMGGFEALRMIPLPDAAAYAIVGGVALGGGLLAVLLGGSRSRS